MEKNRQTTRAARRFGKLGLLALTVALASCITVNVNFPESAVQRAADDFVRDLYKAPAVADNSKANADAEAAGVKSSVRKSSKKKAKTPPAPATPDATTPQAPKTEGGSTYNWSFSLLNEAFAQEINTHTPKAEAIKDKMRARIPDIRKWKEMGVICETGDALLVLKHPEKAGADAGAVSKLVKDENNDRDALYEEIADANKITDRKQTKIRKFFAAAYKEHSPAGTCYEQ